MSGTIALLFLLTAIVLFLVAAAVAPIEPWRSRLGMAGLAAWAFAELIFRGLAK